MGRPIVRTAITRSPSYSKPRTGRWGWSVTPSRRDGTLERLEVPRVADLGAVGEEIGDPQLGVQCRLDAAEVGRRHPLEGDPLDPPATRGAAELVLLLEGRGDVDPAGPAIAVVDPRLVPRVPPTTRDRARALHDRSSTVGLVDSRSVWGGIIPAPAQEASRPSARRSSNVARTPSRART